MNGPEINPNEIYPEFLNGIYIPRNIEECFFELNKILEKDDIEKIRGLKDKSSLIDYHFGIGAYLRNNWGLWHNSRLQNYFEQRSCPHADDMSDAILQYYWEWLNGIHDNWNKFDEI